ncbi:MAG: LysR family transcriptional regulator [Steroidobacteraceae bacterium]|jgi:LysR family transcriptional regulator for bpeEF and oprC|nr:LysR family transcriptional regulator [Steroidobacteraceae bacterium]
MDQLQGMRVFARVAELGSFARAANDLDMSRAMASSYVAQLEKHLGTRLLHRTTRKVTVSPEGAVYLERCKRILDEVQAADDEMRHARARPQGKLRVDVPVAFGRYLLMPALPAFTERYPDVALEVRFNDRFVDLAAEHIDVVLRSGEIRSPDLIARRITSSRLVTCAAPSYIARHGMPQTPGDLRQHRTIGFLRADTSRPSEWKFKQGRDGTQKLKLSFALSFNTSEPMVMSAYEGQGIIQTTDLLLGRAIAEGRVIEILKEYSCEGPPLSVVYPRATQHLAKVRVFAEFAAEIMRKYQARARIPSIER